MAFSRHLLIAVLLVATPILAPDEAVGQVDLSEAAVVAAELKEQASAVRLKPSSEAEETMQTYVDKMAAIAALLETEMRAGKEASDTRELYRELRRVRLDVLELVKSGKVELPPDSAEVFEKLISELGRYYADAQPAVSAGDASLSN